MKSRQYCGQNSAKSKKKRKKKFSTLKNAPWKKKIRKKSSGPFKSLVPCLPGLGLLKSKPTSTLNWIICWIVFWVRETSYCKYKITKIDVSSSVAEKLKATSLYERFIKEQEAEIEEVRKDENMELPIDIDYTNPKLNLSDEEQEKLALTRPTTIGSMSRIPGITPHAVISMLRYAKKQVIAA